MKILGLIFSPRKDGNCSKTLNYCKEKFENLDHEVELINLYDLNINLCRCRTYHCFKNRECIIKDDLKKVYNKCFAADKIIFSIPTYSGHLSSMYFVFSERSQAIFDNYKLYNEKYMEKINLIIVGNLTAGGDMALHEALYPFTNQDYNPETLLLSSLDYNRRTTAGDLIEEAEVKSKLERFVSRVIEK